MKNTSRLCTMILSLTIIFFLKSTDGLSCLICYPISSVPNCFVTDGSCGDNDQSPMPIQTSPVTCYELVIINVPSAYIMTLNGTAFLYHDGIQSPILSDEGVRFLKEIKNKYSKFNGLKSSRDSAISKECVAFFKTDKGFVSDKRLSIISKKEGIPIKSNKLNNPPVSGLKLEIIKDGKIIQETNTDTRGQFNFRKIPDGIFILTVSNPTGNLPEIMTVNIGGNNGILCCCPGPPCDDPLELVVGVKPHQKTNSINIKSSVLISGQIGLKK